MRVKTFLCSLAVVSILIMAGCGGGAGNNSSSSSPSLTSIALQPDPASVSVGSTVALAATAQYSNGTSSALTDATWSSSAPTIASVSTVGVVTGLKGGTATITATAGTMSQSTAVTVKPVLQTLSLTPVGPAVVIGGKQQFQVTGIFNDGSTQDFSSSATWSSSNAGRVTVGSTGQAIGVAAGPVTITATAGGKSGTTVLNVVKNTYAPLLGHYAFTLESSDTRGAALYAGSIDADGKGNITGLEDSNTMSGVEQKIAVSGTYVIYPDGRGNITFKPNKCHPKGITLRVLLAASGTTGALAEFDGLAIATGNLLQQNPAAFNTGAIKGTYVFRAAGIDTRVGAAGLVDGLGEVGMFTANGAGAISSGMEDVNDNGVISGQVALTPSAYSVDTNGRGTMQWITASGTTNYAVYVVNSTEIIFVETDSVTAVSGIADLQTVQTYSTLTDNYSFLIDPPVVLYTGNPAPLDDHVQIGKFNFDASGTLGGTRDGSQITGTYALSQFGINGRGQMQVSGDGLRIYFFYMVSPTRMFILQAFTYSQKQRVSPCTGEAEAQSGFPYSVATFNGNYALQTYNLAQNATSLVWLSMNGTGSVEGVSDVAQNGTVSSTELNSAAFLTVPTVMGNGDLEMENQGGVVDYLFYLVSPQKAWLVGQNPPFDGTLEQQ
jgi:Bacterial Ig-like domain (group 2)